MESTKNVSELLWITVGAYLMIGAGIVTALVLLFSKQKATYGRYGVENAPKLVLPARVAWFLQELPCVLVPVICISLNRCPNFWRFDGNMVVVSLFLIHYLQRTFVFSMLIKGGKPTPVWIFLMAVFFCTWNGHMQAAYHCAYVRYDRFWTSWTTYLGIALFFAGMAINVHSDTILRNLRKPGETGYKIPQGGMFSLVSGANFLGEIVEWLGYAIAARGTLPAVAFAIVTICNIGPRAIHHHRWYQQRFENYPASRKALIPFLL